MTSIDDGTPQVAKLFSKEDRTNDIAAITAMSDLSAECAFFVLESNPEGRFHLNRVQSAQVQSIEDGSITISKPSAISSIYKGATCAIAMPDFRVLVADGK